MQKMMRFMNARQRNIQKDKQKPLVGDNVEIEVLDEQEKEGSVTASFPEKIH